jgi:hypothetical protein
MLDSSLENKSQSKVRDKVPENSLSRPNSLALSSSLGSSHLLHLREREGRGVFLK